jgi:arabinose-5-phosphate isomerase
MLAMGDALALATMDQRPFTAADFAMHHPAGALGRRLLTRVADLMRTGDSLAIVQVDAPIREAMFAVSRAEAGAAIVTHEDGTLAGLITEGDFRRHLLRVTEGEFFRGPCRAAMTATPRVTRPDVLAVDTVAVFNGPPMIGDLPVVDEQNRPVGMLMLKDLVKAGIA